MRTPLRKFFCLLLITPVILLGINASAFPEKVKPSSNTIPMVHLSFVKVAEEPRPKEVKTVRWEKPQVVKGIYATGWMAGSSKWLPRLVNFIDTTELNALVIDVKDDTGTISYKSKVTLAIENEASQNKITDPQKMIQTLREHNIYPIARIVVFKDPFLARKKPEWAVKDISGGLWHDHKGLNWIDPNNRLYWNYVIDIAKEAISLGFQEIQFDYVRFTSDGDLKRCIYPYSTQQLRQDVIQEFLKYSRTQLKSYQIPISADIFGLTTSATDDLGIGQKFEKIASSVDVICPMVYPSHYALGTFGLKNPNSNPYLTVFHGVSDAKRRLDKLGLGSQTPQLRPWLQDFSLGYHYGRNEIQKQIQAVKDAGVQEWIFWNPSCRYDKSKYIN